MDKKELKFYEAPACEVMEMELEGVLCASGDGLPGGGSDIDEGDYE